MAIRIRSECDDSRAPRSHAEALREQPEADWRRGKERLRSASRLTVPDGSRPRLVFELRTIARRTTLGYSLSPGRCAPHTARLSS